MGGVIVVISSVPFQLMMSPAVNPVPFTVSAKASPPALAFGGIQRCQRQAGTHRLDRKRLARDRRATAGAWIGDRDDDAVLRGDVGRENLDRQLPSG